MTENSRKILEFLQKNYGKEFTKHELVEKLDVTMSTVTGSINGLVHKGYATERIETLSARFSGEKATEVRYVQLTKAGLEYDPDEEERKKAQFLLEQRAARKEARRIEKEERAKRNSVL